MISEVSCGPLNTIDFSVNTTTQGDDLYLDQITVTCIPGYKQSGGDLVRNCTSSGTWDGMTLVCKSKFSVLFVKLMTTAINSTDWGIP